MGGSGDGGGGGGRIAAPRQWFQVDCITSLSKRILEGSFGKIKKLKKKIQMHVLWNDAPGVYGPLGSAV